MRLPHCPGAARSRPCQCGWRREWQRISSGLEKAIPLQALTYTNVLELAVGDAADVSEYHATILYQSLGKSREA